MFVLLCKRKGQSHRRFRSQMRTFMQLFLGKVGPSCLGSASAMRALARNLCTLDGKREGPTESQMVYPW